MITTRQEQRLNPPSEIFVISDLHIGGAYGKKPGERGFRINTHVCELVQFIDEVRQRAQAMGVRTELVINGDFVDFLAEEGPKDCHWRAFIPTEAEAVAVFDRLAERDSALFDALRNLLASGVRLTLVLGNHDIELSLPAVRSRLRTFLGADAGTAFRFVYDGEAYVIGDVLIEHGNRYDGWNTVDHDRLRRSRSVYSRRLPISTKSAFEPPPGSQLVVRVMNPIKEDYAFIDLLKPETEAAIPLLLTLEPGYASVSNAVETLRLRMQAEWHGMKAPATPARSGNISAATARNEPPSALDELLTRNMRTPERDQLIALINQAQNGKSARARQISGGTVRGTQSFARLPRSAKEWEDRLPLLLDRFRELQRDRSFTRSVETGKDYFEAAKKLGLSEISRGSHKIEWCGIHNH